MSAIPNPIMPSRSGRENDSSVRPPDNQTARMQIGLAINVRSQVTDTASSALCSKTPFDATPIVPQSTPVPINSNTPGGIRLL
jgi:hypothetical protein